GFLETPYRKVKGRKATEEVTYLTAEQEDLYTIAQANAELNEKNDFVNDRIKSRNKGEFPIVHHEQLQFMDVAPAQIVSAAAALIPFLEHDDANRALMGSNMMRQAVPLMVTEAPIVGTGFEGKIAVDSRAVILAEDDGFIEFVDSNKITVVYDTDPKSIEAITSFDDVRRETYQLIKFSGTNQETSINQKPIVREGQRVKKGEVIADGCATDQGELALGKNVLVAFMPWRGYNFEDAIILSERLVANDTFTSLHVEEFELQVRETKRGEEELTREIPNVSEEAVKNLDENGIIHVGAEVKEGDILIGKITPKGETDPTPEEKLLRAIFGDKAGDVKDASLKASPGIRGTVIKTRLFSRKKKEADGKKVEKKSFDQIETAHKSKVTSHYKKLVDKLTTICDGQTSTGIRDLDGSVVLRSG
ncbi:MAG: DNA-directed RNA polymerase subunit beta, partial [Ignavibacteria bacterium]|nr:DNA-directed RNA polymerase subunit beta [Ignavibacteria bacterium]